jgi:hypothetical protein
MPLSLTTEELDLLLSLAAPIDQRQRDQFLQEVAAELEASGPAGAVGIGSVHRVARTVQRRFFDPPQLPNAGKMARAYLRPAQACVGTDTASDILRRWP